MKQELLTTEIKELYPWLRQLLQSGGKDRICPEGQVTTFHNIGGYSGYRFSDAEGSAEVALGLILGGTGLVLRRTFQGPEASSSRYDYFNQQGEFSFPSEVEALQVLFVDTLEMDLTCPLLNHFYNFLNLEYRKAREGKSSTEMVHSVERYLIELYRSKEIRLAVEDRSNDPAVTKIFNQILKVEMDPVLTWEERQIVFRHHRETLNKILMTKIRAHKLSTPLFRLAMLGKALNNFMDRLLARPTSNALGILNRYTIGKVVWFCQTVKNNLGYSVALAVYGPFTYYFITMPMNPHAMQAVGRVRAAYLDVKSELVQLIDKSSVAVNEISPQKEAIAQEVRDEVSSTQAAAAPAGESQAPKSASVSDQNAKLLANIIYESTVVTNTNDPILVNMGNGKTSEARTSLMNMLVSTDVPMVDRQTWLDRMSQFKQMQIAYEENIEYASRNGRLEQLETQYNFPMQVEATWEELERYNTMIFRLREENPNMSAKMKQYLFNEINRTQQLQVYLWDRLSRFILDQPYVMLDQDKEQRRNDYYVGRSFVFLQQMTNILSWRYKDLKKPHGFDKIEKLADFYEKNRKEFSSVMKNLQANSDLFKQQDVYDTKEFRKYMKRQWEILFLQNAKAEEAANMGLNMYIWSVRNTIWVLQGIYSAKRDELALLMKRDSTGNAFTPAELLERTKIAMLYETLFHNLTLEYVGIREELNKRLGKDIESIQRKVVIDNLKEFLVDREKLDGTNVADSKTTARTTL
jgi:hypothetical protein